MPDVVWEHGQKVGGGFKCKYCREEKGGGGATRSRHFKSETGRYIYECTTSLEWWANMEYVINDVEPLYMFLRFADTDKTPNLSEVIMEYQNMRQTYASKFSSDYCGRTA